MKRIDLIRHLISHGCELFREGGSHSVYINREAQRSSVLNLPDLLDGQRGGVEQVAQPFVAAAGVARFLDVDDPGAKSVYAGNPGDGKFLLHNVFVIGEIRSEADNVFQRR